MTKLLAEFFGTYWVVFGGCGSVILASENPNLGIGFVGISLAFGLSLLTMIYSLGPISGGHFNPAVSFGLWAGGRFSAKDVVPYILAQCIGSIAAAGTLYTIASGKTGFIIDSTKPGSFASNGYGSFSPNGYSLEAVFITEFVLTLFLLLIILGVTDKAGGRKFSGIAIGLGFTLISLISISITNISANPARSLSQAIFVGGEPLFQLWMFWVTPFFGAGIGGLVYKNLLTDHTIY